MQRPVAKRVTLTILATGFVAAVVLYFCAEPPPQDPLGYDRLMNKRYIMELERLGGRSNVLVAELMADFRALWQGENLAYTVAVLTAAAAWLFWYIATFPPENTVHPPSSLTPSETLDTVKRN